MIKKILSAFTLILILLFISCASKPAAGNNESELKLCTNLRPVYVTNTKKIFLLMPEYSAAITDAVQLLEGSFGKTKFSLLSYTQIDQKGISLSLFNDFGTDMGNLSFNGEKINFDSAYFPSALPAEYIVNDIQNAFYDVKALSRNYENAKLIFENTENGEYRRVFDGKNLIEEIRVLNNTVIIKNFLRGYEYKLTKVEE